MAYITDYDKLRYELRDKLNECLKIAKELFTGEDIEGFNLMKDGYALEVYLAVKNAKETV